jgi:hypothetical protein
LIRQCELKLNGIQVMLVRAIDAPALAHERQPIGRVAHNAVDAAIRQSAQHIEAVSVPQFSVANRNFVSHGRLSRESTR